MNFKKITRFYSMLLVALFICFSLNAKNQKVEIETILHAYANDYAQDPMLNQAVSFGVKVGELFWHIQAKPKTDTSMPVVNVLEGKPKQPTFYFKTDFETLQKIDQGKLNALTGAAKAFQSDFAPFDVDIMEGFVPDQNFMPTLFSVFFHFWTKGSPEVIPYGIDYTRFTHGAQASIFYYQPGFRSGYVAIKKGQHANQDEQSKTNPFPTLLIAIKGEGYMIINGEKSVFKAGEAILIPPGVTHEFLNPDNEVPLECILLMFGEGA